MKYHGGTWTVQFVICLVCLLLADLVRADITNLISVADVRLNSGDTNINFGNEVDLVAGTQGFHVDYERNHGLLKFDLTQIPASATVTAVRVTLTVVRSPNLFSYEFELRRLLKPWAELEA